MLTYTAGVQTICWFSIMIYFRIYVTLITVSNALKLHEQKLCKESKNTIQLPKTRLIKVYGCILAWDIVGWVFYAILWRIHECYITTGVYKKRHSMTRTFEIYTEILCFKISAYTFPSERSMSQHEIYLHVLLNIYVLLSLKEYIIILRKNTAVKLEYLLVYPYSLTLNENYNVIIRFKFHLEFFNIEYLL